MGDGVRYERVGAAAVLTIDRPERRNAVDGSTALALREGFERFEADDGARVLVLAGAGGEAFCAGADLKALDLDVDHPAGPMGFSRLAATKPTIAAIDGWCLAGGSVHGPDVHGVASVWTGEVDAAIASVAIAARMQ